MAIKTLAELNAAGRRFWSRDNTLFVVPFETSRFHVAATEDGFIDLATPDSGTYPLSIGEAESMVRSLTSAITEARATKK